MIIYHTITPGEHGSELGNVLRRSLSLSAASVRRLKQSDGIKLNGRTAYTNFRVSQGERLVITLHERECGIVPQMGHIDILYEDRWLLALNKPVGMLVHPSRAKYTETLSNYAYGYLQSNSADGCHTVNRLDRDTSGAVLLAKNAHAKNLAIAALKLPESSKDYLAVVWGAPEEKQGIIDLPIRRLRERDMLRIVAPDGQRAVTEYRVLAQSEHLGQRLSLISFRLVTGKTHQIRVHCHAEGFPILGDGLYYTQASRDLSDSLGVQGQLLHSRLLTLRHPITSENLCIEAPVLRDDMRKVMRGRFEEYL